MPVSRAERVGAALGLIVALVFCAYVIVGLEGLGWKLLFCLPATLVGVDYGPIVAGRASLQDRLKARIHRYKNKG